MRGLFSALVMVMGASLAHGQGTETMQGAIGGVFPAGPSESRLEAGWSLAFGGIYWFSDRIGLHTELGIHRFGMSNLLRTEIGPAKDGLATILAIPVNGVFRLHDVGESGFYVLGGPGLYNRQLELSEPATAPLPRDEPWAGVRAGWTPQATLSTTRAGVNAGIGWEKPMARGYFFVEVRYHRIFTRGLPTEFIPVLFGTRF